MDMYSPNSSNISEWTEWHLTIRGWQKGTQKLEDDTQLKEVKPPEDRVLTCRYHQTIPINSFWVQNHVMEVWKHSDEKLVSDMIERFGDCPQSH